MWSIIFLLFGTLIVAWLASQITPAFVARYMAPDPRVDPAAGRVGRAPGRAVVGLVAIVLCVVFVVHPSSYAPQFKSDMRDIGGEMKPLIHPEHSWWSTRSPTRPRWLGTTCRRACSTQPAIGPVDDPSYMDWVYALKRLTATPTPRRRSIRWLLASSPGQQLLYVRPLTEGVQELEGALDTPGPAARGAVGADPPGRRQQRQCSKPIATGAAQLPAAPASLLTPQCSTRRFPEIPR